MKKSILSLTLCACLANVALNAEKVYKWAEVSSPTTLDPVKSSTKYTNTMVTAIYDTLYEYKYLKSPVELKPSLAQAMPEFSKDGKTITIKIKKGVHFIDDPAFKDGKGREIKASDFVYSMKRHFDPKQRSQGAWLYEGRFVGLDEWKKNGSDYSKEVEGLKALDDYTIQLKLTKPFPQVMYTLAMGFSAVVPKEAVEKYGKEFGVHPVGSGPFILKSHNTSKSILVKNKNFREEYFDLKKEGYDEKTQAYTGVASLQGKRLPIVDKIEANWIKDPEPRWNSFTKGNEIMTAGVPNEHLDEVLESKDPIKLKPEFAKKYKYSVNTEAGFVYNVFNFNDEYFGYAKDPKTNAQNKALRCAIIKSFSWKERISRFYLGIGKAYPGYIVPGTDGFDPNMDKTSIKQDIKTAKKLLKENGWNKKTLPVFTYDTPAGVKSKQFYEQFRGNLVKIGWPKNKIKIKTYATFGDFAKQVGKGKTQTVAQGWGLDYPDAENTLQLFYGPNKAPGSNSANYNNPEYNKLYEQSSVMLPSPERTAIYKKMNKILVDDCVGISGFSRTGIALWHNNVIRYAGNEFIGNTFKYIDVK